MTQRIKDVLKALVKSTTLILLIALLFAAGCSKPVGSTPRDKRASIRNMRDRTLQELYIKRPETRYKVAQAAGYGVFSDIGINIVLISTGNGYGVVTEKSTGRETFMRMGQLGIGPGLGVKDFRAVLIFHRKEALQTFVYQGWDFGSSAEATARSGDKGGEASGVDSFHDVEIYQFTDTGISLQASLTGTKYWMDKELN